jgi:DNA-binding MarR family transcriptional regulator
MIPHRKHMTHREDGAATLADNVRMAHDPRPTDLTPAGKLIEAELKTVIGYQMAQATVAMDRIYETVVGQTEGLHRVEYTVLMLVRANPGCTASSLAKALAVSAPNMALWLERVTAKGLLDRTPSAADRRSNHLHLTQRGEETARVATQAILAAEEALLAGLSVGERAMLAELLHKAAGCRHAIEAAGPLP